MVQKIRVGVVGAGYVASRHLAALRDLPFVEIVGVCDLDQTRAAALATQFDVPRVFRSLDEMAEVRPEVIHILTPPSSHCKLALKALDMNCHVFVEKPMAESVEECDLMIAKARENGLVLSVNHSLLFEPAVQRALWHVDEGAIGDILSLTYFRGSDYPAYPGGPPSPIYTQGSYPFRDLGVHAVYLIERILGPVQKLDVGYRGTGRDPMLTFDEWRLSAECVKGTANAVLSWNMQPLQNEFWVHGTRAVLHVNLFLQQCHVYRNYPGPKQVGFALNGMRHAAAGLFEIPAYLFRGITGRLKPSPGIYSSVVAFHRALRENKDAPVSMEAGRSAAAWVCSASRDADSEKLSKDSKARHKPSPAARVLVTGANGFLGSALTRELLKKGERPRVLLRRPAKAGSAAEELESVIGNLGDPEVVDRAVEGVDVVFHVGAAMGGSANDFEAGTVWGTRNIVEACLKHGVKRLIHVSSIGVLDVAGHPNGLQVDETSSVEPHPDLRGRYTQTKLEAECIVLKAIQERGLPAVIIRPGQIFGPGAEEISPSGVISLFGAWIVAGNGRRALPLVYVDDVVSGLLAAENSSDALGRTIHLVDPTPVTQNQYLEASRPALGSTRVLRLPVTVLMTIAALCDGAAKLTKRPLPLSRYRVRSLRPLHPVDTSAAKNHLAWEPEIGTRMGLQLTFGSYQRTPGLAPAVASRETESQLLN
jgi:predicted dehydrogenase/nucleoside-diphosphate-sugar epimerase